MAIQLAESQQGANHLQINTAHAGAHIADAFEDRRTDRRILQPLIVHHKTLDQVFLKPIEYWAVENIWIDSITRGWRTSGEAFWRKITGVVKCRQCIDFAVFYIGLKITYTLLYTHSLECRSSWKAYIVPNLINEVIGVHPKYKVYSTLLWRFWIHFISWKYFLFSFV